MPVLFVLSIPFSGIFAPRLSNRRTLRRHVSLFSIWSKIFKQFMNFHSIPKLRDCRSKGKVLTSGDKFLHFSLSLPILLVAEALDRIEARRFARRPDAE